MIDGRQFVLSEVVRAITQQCEARGLNFADEARVEVSRRPDRRVTLVTFTFTIPADLG